HHRLICSGSVVARYRPPSPNMGYLETLPFSSGVLLQGKTGNAIAAVDLSCLKLRLALASFPNSGRNFLLSNLILQTPSAACGGPPLKHVPVRLTQQLTTVCRARKQEALLVHCMFILAVTSYRC